MTGRMNQNDKNFIYCQYFFDENSPETHSQCRL